MMRTNNLLIAVFAFIFLGCLPQCIAERWLQGFCGQTNVPRSETDGSFPKPDEEIDIPIGTSKCIRRCAAAPDCNANAFLLLSISQGTDDKMANTRLRNTTRLLSADTTGLNCKGKKLVRTLCTQRHKSVCCADRSIPGRLGLWDLL